MFRKFSEETLRRRGTTPFGHEGVAALEALEGVLSGKRLLDGALLEPLAAFTNLLQSSQLPPEFGNFGFGDALLAAEEAHAELRQDLPQVWEFVPQVPAEKLALLRDFVEPPAAASTDAEHRALLEQLALEAADGPRRGTLLVTGALRCADLPLLQLAERFEHITLSDLDLEALEQMRQRVFPPALQGRVRVERYDPTGSCVAFAEQVASAVGAAQSPAQASSALCEALQSYDVGAGSAGLTELDERVDLALSVLLLSELGQGYRRCVARHLEARGWTSELRRPELAAALELHSRLLEQHHVHALLRRAAAALLVSAVSEVEIETGRGGGRAQQPRDLLGVEHLLERLPQTARVRAERSWEWRRELPKNRSLLTLVEAVVV